MTPYFEDEHSKIWNGDCKTILPLLPENSVDAIVTDPPYELGFMGKSWDKTGIANDVAMWRECLRVLKPGGYLLSFGGSRTYHRMACAIEDAGFEIRDQIAWLYGSGFPKSLDVGKAIDKAARGVPQGGEDPTSANHGKFKGGCSEENPSGRGFGAGPGQFMSESGERQDRALVPTAQPWAGWGTALKPAHEPIVVARKPIEGTVAANILKHGTGALNIDGCRIGWTDGVVPKIGTPAWGGPAKKLTTVPGQDGNTVGRTPPSQLGRWPANVIHDGSDEVLAAFPNTSSGAMKAGTVRAANDHPGSVCYGTYGGNATDVDTYADHGSAARFFYTAKADAWDRNEGLQGLQQDAGRKQGNPDGDNPRNRGVHVRANNHPTVKPTDLMRYLCRLVTQPGGVVLDPFMGSGSTRKAALEENLRFIGIELEERFCAISILRTPQSVLDFSKEQEPCVQP